MFSGCVYTMLHVGFFLLKHRNYVGPHKPREDDEEYFTEKAKNSVSARMSTMNLSLPTFYTFPKHPTICPHSVVLD